MSTISTTNAGAGYRNLSASKFDKTVVSEILGSLFTETHPARSIAVEWLGCDGAKLGDATDDQLEKLLGDLVQAGHIEYSELEAAENGPAGHSASPEPVPVQPEALELATTEPQAPVLGTGLPAQKPDFEMARSFLAALGETHTYQTFDDTKDRKLKHLIRVISGDAGNEIMHRLFNLNADGAGVFVTVNATDGKGRRRGNMVRVRAIFGDFDDPKPGQPGYGVPGYALAQFEAAAAKLPPSIVVESSPGKRHAYWLTNMSPEEGEALQAKMPEAVGCDPAAKDITRVLRIPGFYHRKGEPVLVKVLECHPERIYDAFEIIAAFGLDSIEAKTKTKAKADRGSERAAGASAGLDYDRLDYAINDRDAALLHAALRHVREDGKRAFDPADRATWVDVGMALSRSGEVGFVLFREWSAEAGEEGGYRGEDDCREKFDEFAGYTHSRYPDIFAKAQAAGWVQRPLVSADTPVPDEVPEPANHATPVGWPPGVVGEVATYILNSSRMPVPSFAIAGALSVISYLIRNLGYVEPSDTPLNLYQVLVGGTGKGKEDPRKAIKRILDAMGDRDITAQVVENMSSGTALLRAISPPDEAPYLLMMSDEYGIFMQAAMQGKDEHRRDLVKELMSLYGLARSFHAGKRYADGKNNIPRINNPYVAVLGTTTEEELFAGLNMIAINNGSANRNIYIYADAAVSPNRRPDIDVPKALIDKLQALFSDFALNDLHAMGYGPGAEEALVEFGDNLPTTGKFVNLWSRAEENVIRVAGVLAFCDGKIIKLEHVRWAIEYVKATIQHFDVRSETQISEGHFDKKMNKALEIISNPRHYINDATFSRFTRKGKMPRGKLLNLMKVPAKELEAIVEVLVAGKQINVGTEDGNTIYWS